MTAPLALFSFCLTPAANANPTVESQYALVAERVLVGVTADGAVVSGNFRFHTFPDVMRTWGPPPRPFVVFLPIPIPADLKGADEIEALVHPVAMINGVRCYPERKAGHFDVPSLPGNLRMTVFVFDAYRIEIGEEVSVQVQYDQPVFSVGGKQLIYYLPFLPKFEQYRKEMRLDARDYTISFEGIVGTRLRLAAPVSVVVHEEPASITVQARNMELIAVERRLERMPDPTPAPDTPPRGQEERRH